MKRPWQPAADMVPNLAPMVDVIMVLLVFFLLGTSLALMPEGALRTELDPRSGPGGGQAIQINPRIRIALASTGDGQGCAIYVMDQRLAEDDFQQLYAFLRQKRDDGADLENPVVIAAETDVRWHFVVSAMDAAVRAGFRNVQFAVSLRTGRLGG